ncbi:MAG: hypothetical protein RI928_1686 [Pseudomonadota bacterium]|jgi:P27 family predicted phage terminase small subunit
MPKQERQKKSTVTNLVNTFQTVNILPKPPVLLDEEEMIVFEHLVRSREVSTWSDHDLQMAANLAQTQVQFQGAMDSIKKHGRTLINERGTPVANPECMALNQLGSAIRAFTSQLGLSASQRGVAGNKQKTRNETERNARSILNQVANDEEDLVG